MYDLKCTGSRLTALVLAGAMLLTAAAACAPATPSAPAPSTQTPPSENKEAIKADLDAAATRLDLKLVSDLKLYSHPELPETVAFSVVAGLDRDMVVDGTQPLALVRIPAAKVGDERVAAGYYVVVANEYKEGVLFVHHDAWKTIGGVEWPTGLEPTTKQRGWTTDLIGAVLSGFAKGAWVNRLYLRNCGYWMIDPITGKPHFIWVECPNVVKG